MPTFSFEVDTNVPPEQMIAALTDFTENRLRLWPTIDKRYYKVLNLSETSADVEEGSAVFGGIYGREHYDWSTPGLVCATVAGSNIAVDGGTWEHRISPGPDGGSHVEVNFDRKMHGLKGSLIAFFLGLAADKAFKTNFMKTVKILESESATSS